ncbi:TonB-dependent siderophore receptor [Hwanghaeella sp.]|uniref:TonB-dependent siderophore receptor n=1 Tax=Hwanghaeella sp. TaxID=2605943 RepID=UPI003CCC4496
MKQYLGIVDFREAARAAVIAFVAAGCVGTAPHQAAASTAQLAQSREAIPFDIPQMPLAQALTIFGQQSGYQVSVHGTVVDGIDSGRVDGKMTADEALNILLNGTGITYRIDGADTVTLTRAAEGDSETLLSPVTVEGKIDSAYGPVDGYVAENAGSGTKSDTPLIETAQSISVITRDKMDSQNVNRMAEALRYTPGIDSENFGYEPRYVDMRLRGLEAATTGFFKDGMLLSNPGFAVSYNPDPWGAERVEVPRGPSSVLYGQGAPGGLVNYVSKRPSTTRLITGEIETGSFSRIQGKFDLGGAITNQKDSAFRLTGLFRRSDTQIDFLQDDREFIAPTVSAFIGEDTKVTLLTSYQHDSTRNSQSLPGSGTITDNPNGSVPIGRFVGEPDVDKYDRHTYEAGYELEHDFTRDLSLFHTVRYNYVDLDDEVVFANGLLADSRTITRAYFANLGDLDGVTSDTRVNWELGNETWKHNLLGGIDIQYISLQSEQRFGAAPNLDIFNPVYGGHVSIPQPFKDDETELTQLGLYAQDQIELGDHWRFNLGGRFDRARSETLNNLTGAKSTQRDTAFTWRGGLVYLFDSGFAPYASYSESFLPSIGTDAAGNPFKPETGQQYEVGVKYQPPGYNSFITVAAFDLTRQNDLETDPATFLQVQTAEQRSRGIEVEAVASLDFGLDLTGALTFLETEVTESVNNSIVGKEIKFVPREYASLWADYTIQNGDYKGLGFGAGVRYRGASFADDANTVSAPGHTVFDASLHYNWRQLRVGLNVHNLLDEEYVGSCFLRSGTVFCTAGEARSVKATLGMTW